MMSRWCDQSIHDAGHSDKPNGLLFGRNVVWNPCRGDHLGQRSRASAPEGRTYGRKRSDQSTAETPCEEGAVHIWVYVRDDRPFGGHGPPAAMFYYSRDRKGEHPQRHLAGYAGLFQADAFDGYRALYLPQRHAGAILEVGCWSHARRPFFAMADIAENARRRAAGRSAVALSPIAIEVVRRIDTLFEVERSIDGKSAEERRTVRQERSKPLVEELQV